MIIAKMLVLKRLKPRPPQHAERGREDLHRDHLFQLDIGGAFLTTLERAYRGFTLVNKNKKELENL